MPNLKELEDDIKKKTPLLLSVGMISTLIIVIFSLAASVWASSSALNSRVTSEIKGIQTRLEAHIAAQNVRNEHFERTCREILDTLHKHEKIADDQSERLHEIRELILTLGPRDKGRDK